jgi:hypothetical protein
VERGRDVRGRPGPNGPPGNNHENGPGPNRKRQWDDKNNNSMGPNSRNRSMYDRDVSGRGSMNKNGPPPQMSDGRPKWGPESPMYKTVLCTRWKAGKCMIPNCNFAHGPGELRPFPPGYTPPARHLGSGDSRAANSGGASGRPNSGPPAWSGGMCIFFLFVLISLVCLFYSILFYHVTFSHC